MNNLMIKEVDFQGDTLLAIKRNDDKIFVSIAYICDGLGLTEGQKKRQVNNIREDIVLSQGCEIIKVDLHNVQSRDLLCIELDYLPLWLAKISVTPKMKQDSPETVSKLISYQLKVKEILANAFIHNVTQIVPKTYKEALLALVESIEEKEKLEAENKILLPKAQVHDQIVDASNLVSVNKVAKNIGIGELKFFTFLRATKVFYKEGTANLPFQKYQNEDYFEVKTRTNTDQEGNSFITYTTKVTGKGEVFLLNLVNKFGGAKKINSLKMKDISEYISNYNVVPMVIE